jgi:hypothetical protein
MSSGRLGRIVIEGGVDALLGGSEGRTMADILEKGVEILGDVRGACRR